MNLFAKNLNLEFHHEWQDEVFSANGCLFIVSFYKQEGLLMQREVYENSNLMKRFNADAVLVEKFESIINS